MSGHSKWATTKHKKAVIDARRGKMFAKLIKNIEVAARMGGGDPAGNPTLYDAIQKAKKSSVPNDNIDRAVKRGSGAEAGGADYTTIMYEGYGPAGVAMLIECLTDNKNRAAMEVRTAMTRNGGSLADPGSVSFLFNRKGVVLVPAAQDGKTVTEDDVLEAALDAGAEAGGADYTTIMYEGYGPAGVAMLIEGLTDNRNRAAMEVRTAMTRNGGSLADPGSVSFLFNRKGVVIVPQDQDGKTISEDDVLEAALDAGAEDVNDLGESFEVVSEATDLVAVRSALQAAGIDYDSAEAEFVPDMQVQLDKDNAAKLFRLIEALEDSDDVQNVFANFDVSDEIMAELDA
jgi:YebC/PmpR family DNA-binding regulatory protein